MGSTGTEDQDFADDSGRERSLQMQLDCGAHATADPAASIRLKRRKNILRHFEVLSLGKEDYLGALNTIAGGGWIGAKIYNVLLLRCAARCAVERIYTFKSGTSGTGT
jgi:hypothetical protein